MSTSKTAAQLVEERINRVVDKAPSWDELPIESRNTLLRIFRNVSLPAVAEESA